MASSVILIPARYHSTRLPGKPLVKLDGVPMIRWVFERCRKAALSLDVDIRVLTDDKRIAELFSPNEVWIDSKAYKNGTERCAGFAETEWGKLYDRFINVQGDMPDVTADIIKHVYYNLNQYKVTTAHTDMSPDRRLDPSVVKQINGAGTALWFGRGFTKYGVHHLGIYGYSREALLKYIDLPVTTEEDIEALEQLRWLKNGWQIGTQSVYYKGIEINTPEDVDRWHQNKRSL